MSNISSYNIKFNDSTWEIFGDESSITCYNRTGFKSMNRLDLERDENKDFGQSGNTFSYEDWMAFTGSDLLRTDHPKEALPIIYYATQILGYPNIERIRNTKYKFSHI